MRGEDKQAGGKRCNKWRYAGWGLAAALLALPFVAMQVTDEVDWGISDFITFGVMLIVAGGMVELAARQSGNGFYRAGAGVAVAAAFLLVWVNLAVGFLGSEKNDANLMFGGVIAVALGGAIIADFRAPGMVKAMVATALAQALVGGIALAAQLGSAGAAGLYEVAVGTALFGALWLLSAWLFRKAAARQAASA
jgi:hypothetical protein